MRIDRITIKDFGPFRREVVELPIGEIPPGVVAVAGDNGQGKTTLLEAMGPGVVYRTLPGREDADPVLFATSREAMIEEQFSIDGIGSFVVRLNLDGPKRQTDALVEQVLADGTRVKLTDGKRSTYDAWVRERFPSLDLFLNSSFAAQGRGDEFTRRKPSQRKDLFVEFLALQHYAAMSQQASAAADLAADAVLRLTVRQEHLEGETAPALQADLDTLAKELQARGGNAEVRQRELTQALADLDTRAALLADQVAAYAAATQRVQTLDRDLAARYAEGARARQTREQAQADVQAEFAAIQTRQTKQIADIDTRIAGNQRVLTQADVIRAAVAALVTIDQQLMDARTRERELQDRRDHVSKDLAAAEAAVHAFTKPKADLQRATDDAALLKDVPCRGVDEYAACRFLVNATAAAARITALEAQVAGIAQALERRGALLGEATQRDQQLAGVRRTIAQLEQQRAEADKTARYDKSLVEAETRIAEQRAKRAEVETEAVRQTDACSERWHARILEFDAHTLTLNDVIARLTRELSAARRDLEAATSGNQAAAALDGERAAVRRELDTVLATIGAVEHGHHDLDRRRQELAAKLTRLAEVRQRRARVETELLEWRSLAKDLGKGGLPDLEIDAAGPTISATTNEILLHCMGPRFSTELVTQVAKADGSGMRDDFTVRVFDNEDGGMARDISALSGGEKTIVQEALMCAIALYVIARSPMPIRTLWRDETGAALSPTNAVRYVEMLRKVRELGTLHHVFFISHNTEAIARADTQIRVAGGTAAIVYPPFREEAA